MSYPPHMIALRVFWLLVICQLLAVGVASADVRLPRIIGDHMVLQRDSKISVWGWAAPGEHIQIAFHGQIVKTRPDKGGRWTATLGPFPAGGPYVMTIAGRNRIALNDVFLGDVWLASGQSNMEFTLGHGPDYMGVSNAEQEIANTHYPQLRLFKVHRKVRIKPAEDVESDSWTASSPQTAANFSAVAYLFGRELHQRYHIPIGLIETSWGGTMAEAWISADSLKSFPEFQQSIESLKRIDEQSATAEYDRYLKQRAAWYAAHAGDDRGRADGQDIWAATDLDTNAWPTVVEPQTGPEEAFKGFDGVVWFRKELDIPAAAARKPLVLHLTYAYKSDTTFFNGVKIGETPEGDKPKDYSVPGELVKAGRNVIAVRLKGSYGGVGMWSDDASKLSAEVNGKVIPLAGPWSYQPGPDLADLPKPSAFAKMQSEPNTATLLFNGMLAPITPYRIKGVIWYQGEANADRPAQYRTLFPTLIRDWRSQWGYEVPFLFVQLAGFQPNKDEPADYPWAELREAQGMALALPATGMATAVDIGDENDIHPRNKQDVAHRLVLAAAKVVYGERLVYSGPTYQSMQVDGSRARITFSNIGSGLQVKDKYGYVRGFEIAGGDGKFYWARGQKEGNVVIVTDAAVLQPVAVRYDWRNTPDGNLYNKEGLPALPFRTDAPTP